MVTPPVVLVPAFGVAGAATFVLSLEPGTKVTYSWLTEIITSYSGSEQRISWQALPAIRIEGSAFLLDPDDRSTRAALMHSAASGATFLIALPTEEVTVNGVTGTGTTLTIGDTSSCDWALPGQRVILIGANDITGPAVVQSTTPTTIIVDAIPVGVNALGSRIMPMVPAVLDSQQGFTRYPVTVGLWDVRAKAVAYGWCGSDVMGAGAAVLTFDSGLVAATELTADSLIIWDRPNAIDGTGSETMASKAEVVDLGGLAFSIGGSEVSDWLRPIKLRSTSVADRQWLKAVARHVRGAQGVFLLPTGRSDLVFSALPGFAQLTVATDYVSWFPSLAHRRLAVSVASAAVVQYVDVLSAVDNNDGTNTLTLSDNLFGPITKISFLEQVRLETDDVSIVWDGAVMTCDLVAHVVQDVTATTEDVVTSAFAGHGLDGDVDFPVGTFSMTRDMYWETGRLASGSVILTNGFVPHFRTALIGPATGTALVHRNGANASGATGGVGYAAGTGTISGGSGTGKTGTNGAGSAAAPGGFWPTTSHPGFGGAGGSGTTAGGPAGGGPNSLEPDATGSIDDVFAAIRMRLMTANTTAITGGAGGSSGGGSTTFAGGGGGAGAANVVICAGQFINAANIIVQAIGGTGGAGVAVNCGGGGGGGGAAIAIATGRLPFPATITNTGGAGGASGGGTGTAGSAGDPGPSPMLFVG